MSPHITKRILLLVANGVDIREAVNKVLGAGNYEKLASDLHDILNGRA